MFFSNEATENILKLDIILEENDINMKIMYFDSIKLKDPNPKNINKFIFETVDQLNQYSASEVIG